MSLSFRPLVVPSTATVTVSISKDSPQKKASVYADGRQQSDLLAQQEVLIQKSNFGVKRMPCKFI